MPSQRPVLYLIDASSYVYRAFHALPPLTSPTGLPTNAVYGFSTMLMKLLREVQPGYVAAVFDTPGPTFRDDLFAAYKANRPLMPDDLAVQLPLVHEVVDAFGIYSLAVPGVEADDVIGSVAVRTAAAGADVVIVSGDKDLMQLVGPAVRVWDTMRDRIFDEVAVRERWGVAPARIPDVMGLMGDAVDNIPGVKGIGEKTATALIQHFGSVEELLARLDELARSTTIRGAKKLASTLRDEAEGARLSRTLAVVRCDVDLDCDLERFRLRPRANDVLRAIFGRLGFQSLVRDIAATAPAVTVTAERVGDPSKWDDLAALARAAGQIAIAWAPGGAGAGTITLAPPGRTPVEVPLDDAAAVAGVLGVLCDPQVEKVAHDWKHDLHGLAALTDIDSMGPAFDAMVASYLLEATATHELQELAIAVLGARLPAFRAEPAWMASGVSVLCELRNRLAPRLEQQGLTRLFFDLEMPLVTVLTRMERHGIRVDAAALADMGAEMTLRLAALEKEIYELAGGPFNIGSPAQLREVLFERLALPRKGVKRTKTGLSTDVDVLSRLAAIHPLPQKILDYRSVAKLKSTYVDALQAALNPQTGRLHTTFNQTVATTGRLSSSDPNLQNIPVRTEEGRRIRQAFVAADGCRLVVADYSQIELRLLAHLSGDAALVAAFQAGDDVHTRTAAEVFEVLPGVVSAEMRRAAKAINFGIIYGMGPPRLARELGIPLERAEAYIGNYFARYAGVRSYLEATLAEARERGYVTTLLGRRRGVPDLISVDRRVAQAAERVAANTPIQGSAADLIKLAMVAIDRRIRAERLPVAMLLQVHDELVFEVPEARCDEVATLVCREMETVYPLRVPLRVDVGSGRTWAEAH
ncbi:DNA polymerase I [Candidatus Binatia bacterium]|nr:DNA polymerase I [Candidatus Binatia bacterium]